MNGIGQKKRYRDKPFKKIDFLKIVESTIHATAICKPYAHFRIDHTKRVYKIAKRLSYGYTNVKIDLDKVKVMCYIHDMFKYIADTHDHGKCAASYLKIIIDEYYPFGQERSEWDLIIEAIENHSNKEMFIKVFNPYLALLADADMLDKIHIQHVKSLNNVFMKNQTLMETKNNLINAIKDYPGFSPNYQHIKKEMIDYLNDKIK